MKKLASFLCVIVLSAIGMMLGHWLGAHLEGPTASAEVQPAAKVSVVSTHTLEVVGADGRRQIVMGTSPEGSPGIWIYDRNGKVRLSLGLYGDNNRRRSWSSRWRDHPLPKFEGATSRA